jgi:hypothetical protein
LLLRLLLRNLLQPRPSWLRVRAAAAATIRYAPILLAFSAAHTLLPVLLLLLLGERSDLLGLS